MARNVIVCVNTPVQIVNNFARFLTIPKPCLLLALASMTVLTCLWLLLRVEATRRADVESQQTRDEQKINAKCLSKLVRNAAQPWTDPLLGYGQDEYQCVLNEWYNHNPPKGVVIGLGCQKCGSTALVKLLKATKKTTYPKELIVSTDEFRYWDDQRCNRNISNPNQSKTDKLLATAKYNLRVSLQNKQTK
ncbi:hypothetical protein RFI_19686 [Reticulomyxa filosa]|uniref:Sulfotransferase domain-containing protein n=1 Tax=Reticulomyxa filosa TaxID=46433 RepID=X6MUW0_RETFI|nr:hypothetical protein RFI_19686 [Reticulomyxa filosa]|eukprot:ETO17634.1 hypothetical protein RFI_19686 [Reticulomyxa filosa]